MPNPIEVVRTSTQLFSTAVRAAEAESQFDAPSGGAGIAALAGTRKDPGYEFSNGRRFQDATGSYE